MSTKQQEWTTGLINPFSEKFVEYWNLWKQYKNEEFKFKYKGCLSEQAALMKLNDLSEGNEEIAVKIIRQSMENSWKGLFQLPQLIQNGQSATKTREDVSNVLGARNYERG